MNNKGARLIRQAIQPIGGEVAAEYPRYLGPEDHAHIVRVDAWAPIKHIIGALAAAGLMHTSGEELNPSRPSLEFLPVDFSEKYTTTYYMSTAYFRDVAAPSSNTTPASGE